MNKIYRTLNLHVAWLVEINSPNCMGGIKNIIGIKVHYHDKNLFYSLLDDCFFYVFSQEELSKDNVGRLFAKIYGYHKSYEFKTFGMELYDYTKKDYITKPEIIRIKKNKDWLFGYQATLFMNY